MNRDPIEAVLDRVAAELDWLSPPPIFVGGATIGLYVDAAARAVLRPTDDVDCIVPSIDSRPRWWALEETLRGHHWVPVPEGPICRYRSPSGVSVDLMPEDPSILGFGGRWYEQAVIRAEPRTLSSGRVVQIPPVALMLACKLEAWQDRGIGDPYASKDLEDITVLVDGVHRIAAAVAAAAADIRAFVSSSMGTILNTPRHLEIMQAQLPRFGDLHARELRLEATMLGIVRLSST